MSFSFCHRTKTIGGDTRSDLLLGPTESFDELVKGLTKSFRNRGSSIEIVVLSHDSEIETQTILLEPDQLEIIASTIETFPDMIFDADNFERLTKLGSFS